MDWMKLLPLGGVALGCAMRTLLPYLVSALEQVKKGEKWPAWDGQYWLPPLATFVLAIIGYVVSAFTTPGLFEMLIALPFVAAVGIGYSGQDLVRLIQKASTPVIK